MLPGAVALIGTMWLWDDLLPWTWSDTLRNILPKESSAAYGGAVVLLFFGLCHVLGVVLASISYEVIDKWIAKRHWPLDVTGLQHSLGTTEIQQLKKRFQKYFGDAFDGSKLEQNSFTCAYYALSADVNLGMMASRADAELLGNRSFVLVSFLLLIGTIGRQIWHHHFGKPVHWLAIPFWLVFLLGSIPTYKYHREKKTYGRFAMFIALTGKAKDAVPAKRDWRCNDV